MVFGWWWYMFWASHVKMRARWVSDCNMWTKLQIWSKLQIGCCNAFQTMVNLLVLTWSSIRSLLRSKLTFMKNVLKKSSKGRVNGLISKQGFFLPCLNQPNNLPAHLFHIYRLCEVVFHYWFFWIIYAHLNATEFETGRYEPRCINFLLNACRSCLSPWFISIWHYKTMCGPC